MKKKFSLYLIKIGLIDEKTNSPILQNSIISNDKNFTNESFYYLMNFFDNLTIEQKKYMSFYIPEKYKINTEENTKSKLKSIIIHLQLRQKIILLKYFFLWKRNINLNIYKNSSNNYYISNINKNIENIKNIQNQDIQKNNLEQNKFENENNVNLNLDLLLNKDDYSIENIDNKINQKIDEVEPINKLNQINQNTISFDDFFTKNENNYDKKLYNKNHNRKNEYISNKQIIYNNNTINKKNKFFNRKIGRKLSDIIKYGDFKNHFKDSNIQINKKYKTQRNSKKRSNLYTSLEEKELEELKECTFRPKINNSRAINRIRNNISEEKDTSTIISKKGIQSTFDKLYHDNEKYKLTKEMKTIDHEYLLGKKISFTPNIINNYYFRKSYSSYSKGDKNFEERQNEYLFKRNQKCEELKNKINSDNERLCSFNPKINNVQREYYQIKNEKNISIPVFERLYEDCIKRKVWQEQKEFENINKFNNLPNCKSQKRVLNKDLINKLYENKKEEIINRTREKIDKEIGITFNPQINDNDYLKKVNGTFLERNEKMVNKKNIFVEEEKIKQIENLKKSKAKKYTKEERLQIVNNIIKRLYNNKNHNTDKNKKE